MKNLISKQNGEDMSKEVGIDDLIEEVVEELVEELTDSPELEQAKKDYMEIQRAYQLMITGTYQAALCFKLKESLDWMDNHAKFLHKRIGEIIKKEKVADSE